MPLCCKTRQVALECSAHITSCTSVVGPPNSKVVKNLERVYLCEDFEQKSTASL
jgi:hypothetical protein